MNRMAFAQPNLKMGKRLLQLQWVLDAFFFATAGTKKKALQKKKCRFVGLCAPHPHSLFEKSETKTLIALRANFFTTLTFSPLPIRGYSHTSRMLWISTRSMHTETVSSPFHTKGSSLPSGRRTSFLGALCKETESFTSKTGGM